MFDFSGSDIARSALIALAVVSLSGCLLDDWDGDGDGVKDDIGFWWPTTAINTARLNCLSNSYASDVTMSRKPTPYVADGGGLVYLNYVYNYKTRLKDADCYQKGKYLGGTNSGGWITKTWEKDARFNFQVNGNNLYLFDAAEAACFGDPNQDPDLIVRAVNCNTNTANDAEGLLVTNIGGTISESYWTGPGPRP